MPLFVLVKRSEDFEELLLVPAYNLVNFLRRLVLPRKIKGWSLRSLPLKLLVFNA